MEHVLWLEYNLNNNGFSVETYWFDLAMPMRTIYLVVTIWAGVKLIKGRKLVRKSTASIVSDTTNIGDIDDF